MKIPLLDHGYVQFIEAWGSDQRVIEAARMSTDKGFLGWEPQHAYKCSQCEYLCALPKPITYSHCPNDRCPGEMIEDKARSHPGDAKLLAFLYRNEHHTPFEMGGLIIEVKAPLFVFREWHRHRTQSYNELSARYTPLPNENYKPDLDNVMRRSGPNANRQAAGSKVLELSDAIAWIGMVEAAYLSAQIAYEFGLQVGVSKEIARITTPVGRYSKMRASANLRNWLHFLELREHPRAQEEIRVFAKAVGLIVQDHFPRTHALFKEAPQA